MNCPKCKKAVAEDSLYCPSCGKRLYQKNIDETAYGKFMTLLFLASTPFVWVANILGWVVGGAWLLLLGDWRVLVAAVLAAVVASFILTILLMLDYPLGLLTVWLMKKNQHFLGAVSLIFNDSLVFLIMTFWVFISFSEALYFGKGSGQSILPFLLVGYGVAVAPLQSKVSPDDGNMTFVTLWYVCISYLILIFLFYLGLLSWAVITMGVLFLLCIIYLVKDFNLATKSLTSGDFS